MKDRLEGLARAAVRRPVLTVAIVLAAALAGGILALGLKPSAGTDTFVSSSSASFQATAEDQKRFGGDPVVILIKEPLTDIVETKELGTITQLEACLAGQVVVPTTVSFTPAPRGTKPPYGGYSSPCAKLMRYEPAQVVYGPGTFLNRAVTAVNEQVQAMLSGAQKAIASAKSAAYQLALGRGYSRARALSVANQAATLESQLETEQLARLYLNSGISGTPRIDDPQFIPQIVFDQTRGVNQPKSRFAYLFPTADSALIQVRLKANLSDAEQARAISWIREAVQMPMFRLAYGGTYTVTGAPVVVNDLATQITGAISGLLIAVLLVMAATLLVVFRGRLRLLPLAIALAAAGITFGAMALVGASLTMASIAVLPILIGLAVDYAIQFQSRAEEARSEGALAEGARAAGALAEGARAAGARAAGARAADGVGAGTRASGTAEHAVRRAAAVGAPTIAVAALATGTGFLVLLLSPVPMVRGFGLLLVAGIAIAFACTLTAGSAAMALNDRDFGALGASLRGAGQLLREARSPIARPAGRLPRRPSPAPRLRRAHDDRPIPPLIASRALRAAAKHPARLLAVGFVLAALGWVADTQTSVQSDVTKLVPANMQALRDLRTLENVTGVSGEIDVTVRASDVATPQVVGWMVGYQQALLKHYGYLETKGCAHATLCPALSLSDLFTGGAQSGQGASSSLSRSQIQGLLAAVPSYFSQAVITPDHREATLAFGIRLMPLSRQQRVIDYMRSRLRPPSGVTARLAGLPVLAAEANSALSSSGRRLLTLLAGLIAVGLVLLAVFRQAERALVPLVPIALATGWSALILFVIGIPLNPMSATLGALVIAISTEFSVLLSERFRQERRAGYEPSDALERTYRFTGAAVLASGITAIAGFGVLVLSDITMLRDFGFVTLVDLTVSLGGVLLVLPAVLALSEREDAVARARGLWRRAGMTLPRMRRRARVA